MIVGDSLKNDTYLTDSTEIELNDACMFVLLINRD